MIDRSKLGLILGVMAAAGMMGGRAGAQTPAPAASPAAAAKACCQGHAGKEGHDHSKCAMHAAGAEHDHSKCRMHSDQAAGDATAKKDAGASKCPFRSGEAKKAAAAKAAGSKPEVSASGFVCPMHPEVTSKTKDRCPKCGMFLEEKKR